jgi:protein phosphatase
MADKHAECAPPGEAALLTAGDRPQSAFLAESGVLQAHGVSEAGIRKTNEDGFTSDLSLNLFAVADGLGGHRAGEVASRLAIESVSQFVRHAAEDADVGWPYGLDDTLSIEGNRLRTAIHLANSRIRQEAEGRDDYSGMGTTICAMLVNESHLSIGSVGDSRLYALSHGELRQVTRDDSWAATVLAQDPGFDPKKLERHPLRHVLTSALGGQERIDVKIIEQPLVSGDVFLLCTDGLYGVVAADRLKDILLSTPDVDAAARALVDAAVEGGSRDNVTAVVVRYEADGSRATDDDISREADQSGH